MPSYVDILVVPAVIEPGAGCPLPSLLAAALSEDISTSLILVTDYPDEIILGNSMDIHSRNQGNFNSRRDVHCTD
jgi:nicotinamide N-methyltransferase